MHNAGKEHWQAVKRILRYIHNTVDIGLVFEQDVDVGQHIVGYCEILTMQEIWTSVDRQLAIIHFSKSVS